MSHLLYVVYVLYNKIQIADVQATMPFSRWKAEEILYESMMDKQYRTVKKIIYSWILFVVYTVCGWSFLMLILRICHAGL